MTTRAIVAPFPEVVFADASYAPWQAIAAADAIARVVSFFGDILLLEESRDAEI